MLAELLDWRGNDADGEFALDGFAEDTSEGGREDDDVDDDVDARGGSEEATASG